MKKFTLSMVAVMAMSTFAIAQTYDAYGPNSYKALHEGEQHEGQDTNKAYIGLGYSYINMNTGVSAPPLGKLFEIDIQGNGITLLAGYEINQYFAVEGRYSKTINDLNVDINIQDIDEGGKWGGHISNAGLYLKPKYSSGAVTLYGLLGVGHFKYDIDYAGEVSSNEFQWGLGISFDAGNSFIANSDVSLFMDYTRFSDDEYYGENVVLDAFNFGLIFKF